MCPTRSMGLTHYRAKWSFLYNPVVRIFPLRIYYTKSRILLWDPHRVIRTIQDEPYPLWDVSLDITLIGTGLTIWLNIWLKNMIRRWCWITANMTWITFSSCAQSYGETHSYLTKIWGYIFKRDRYYSFVIDA